MNGLLARSTENLLTRRSQSPLLPPVVVVPSIGMDNREDGAKPSQPRYCKGYSAGMTPLVVDGEGARRGTEAQARKPATALSLFVAVSAG